MKSGLYVNSTKKIINETIIDAFRIGKCIDYDDRYSSHKSSDPNLISNYKFIVIENEIQRTRLEKKLFNKLKQFHLHDSFYLDTIDSRKIIDKFVEQEKLLIEQKKDKSTNKTISTLEGEVPFKENIPNCAFLSGYKAGAIYNTKTQKGKTRYRKLFGLPCSDTAHKLYIKFKRLIQKENNCTILNV